MCHNQTVSWLTEGDWQRVREVLAGVRSPVRLILFTQSIDCHDCLSARQLLDEVVLLSDNLTFVEYDLVFDVEQVRSYGVDKAPAIVIVGEEDTGIRFIGRPAGYEFSSLIDGILLASSGCSGLSEESREILATVTAPLHIRVFVTPTCPDCCRVVGLAQRMALENSNIITSVVDATVFPDLVRKYHITGVPKTVVNNGAEILGAQPEELFVRQVLP